MSRSNGKVRVAPRAKAAERESLEILLKSQLGPIEWARKFERYLELEGVWRGPGSPGKAATGQVSGGNSATVALIAERFGVARRTAFDRLKWARELAPHRALAAAVDRGEISIRQALVKVGAHNGHADLGNGVSKPDLGDGVSHPAPFSRALLPVFAEVLDGAKTVLDPFAGIGRIHELERWGYDTVGVEIEPEWAARHERTKVGDALALDFGDESFDAVCTSPTYGNRMADHHDARDASTRRSYRHDLGRPLHKHNSGRLQWGTAYRECHEQAWEEAWRVVRAGGKLMLNIKDHVRNGRRQFVAGWHVTTLCRMGFTLLQHREVATPAMRAGENSDLRYPEQVYAFVKDPS